MENQKLKPVTFVSGRYTYHSQNTTQQILLLKALKMTQDPKKLKELIGVKTVADVYRTLDKLAMRKEYHAALSRSGISFDYMVDNLKKMVDNGFKDSDKLKALSMLMRSIGMDKYEQEGNAGGNWEEALIRAEEKKDGGEQKRLPTSDPVYDVKFPTMPDSLKKRKDKEHQSGKDLYDGQ